MEFTSYFAEKLYIDSISSRLSDAERLIRLELMEQIINSGSPVDEAEIKQLNTRHDMDFETGISSLFNKNDVLAKNPDGDITCVHPVSALPTNHKVCLQDGRKFHAMCAVDALGAAFTFEQDISVTSVCSYCQEPINITIRNGEIAELQPANTYVLHADLNRITNWAASC